MRAQKEPPINPMLSAGIRTLFRTGRPAECILAFLQKGGQYQNITIEDVRKLQIRKGTVCVNGSIIKRFCFPRRFQKLVRSILKLEGMTPVKALEYLHAVKGCTELTLDDIEHLRPRKRVFQGETA